MMDTCNDYFVHNLSSGSASSATSALKGNTITDDGGSTAVNDLSTQQHHHLLQHNSHPQHLIAPVAPTITNHHPQQPGKFTLGNGNGATTSYSTSSSSTGAHSVLASSSVGSGTTTATGGTLQATVYPIQQLPKLPNSPSPLESLKASIITESVPSYHHHHPHIQGSYLQNQEEGGSNSVWSPSTGGCGVTRNDHLSGGPATGGYTDNGSAGKVLMANANSGQVNFNANLTSNCVQGNDSLAYNVTGNYGDNGLVQGPNSNLGYSSAQHALYLNTNYGTGTSGGLGGDGHMLDFNNSSKCTYNNSSALISSQAATSPYHHYSPATQQVGYSSNTGGGGGAGNAGMQKVISNGGSSYSSNNMNSQMRSGNQSQSYDLSIATGQLEYQTQYPAAAPVAPVDAVGQRTYMDLSASKPQTNHSSYYPAQVHQVAGKSKRYAAYEDMPTSQFLMQDYSYNGYKGHPSLVPPVPQIPAHAQQMPRGHYGRQGSASAPGSHQGDPKIYRRSYPIPYKTDNSGMKPVHMNYHPQYGYTTDPMAGKRVPTYAHHPPSPSAGHQMPMSNGYSDPIYDLENAKKKAAYSNVVHSGKYHYPYYEDYRTNPKAAPPPQPISGQYGLMGSNMQIHPSPRPNYYPNGYINYQHHPHKPPPGYNGGAVGAFYPSGPPQQSDLYANYMKTHSITGLPKAMDQLDAHSAAMGKYNRNCYYDTNVPPAGEKTYVDLEDQINSSKITKARNGYPMDFPPHQPFYDPHHAQGHMPYSAKYCPERYLYHPNQQPSYYYPGAAVPGAMPHSNMNPTQPNSGHHMLHSSVPAYNDNGKNINVREFLSSWNDDEEEAGVGGTTAGVYTEEYQQAFQKGLLDPNTQRIQVGISIDKANVMDSTGLVNLPDIIIDIEKQQKTAIPEIDLTDDAPEETNSAGAAEKLYVLESIDVPFSELNKYKHLNVINKLPENVVHFNKDGGESAEVGVMELFNESELIHAAVLPSEESKSVKVEVGASAVENSLKFIEDIESNSDFKNDFELNVEYESFPNEKSQDTIVSTTTRETSLAEMSTLAEDNCQVTGGRKESVIVAVNMKVKREDIKRKKKLKKALKALKAQQTVAAVAYDSEKEDDVFIPQSGFKSLVKCCLDVINTKLFRRNAHSYLARTAQPPAQDQSPVPRIYKYIRRLDSRNPVKIFNPKSLREMCAANVIKLNLVTIHEIDDDQGCWRDGGVPALKDLCEEVLQRNNFIINMDMDYCATIDSPRDGLAAKGLGNEPLMMVDLDDNNNNNNFAMLSGLPVDDSASTEKGPDNMADEMERKNGQSPDFEMGTAFVGSESTPSAYLLQDDALMNCDYFLAEADGGDQIQFSEEVVPVDPDRFKRKQLTDMLRLKYVHNPQNIHALDSRRMILKKYFYYQKFVAMVKSRPVYNDKQRRHRNDTFIVALQNHYQNLMKVRRQWSKKSKSIVIEPVTEQLSHPPPPMVIRPRREGPAPRVTLPSALATITPQTITEAAHSDTIMKLIREGIADRARKSAIVIEASGRDDKSDSDTEVILVTVEKEPIYREGKGRPAIDNNHLGRRQDKNQVERIISIESVQQRKPKESKPNTMSAKEIPKEEFEPKRRRTTEKAPTESPIIETLTREACLHRPHDPQSGHNRKKFKPKFDDILLGIDNIYRDVKAKPRQLKPLKAFEQIDDLSIGSPSSVKSSSTTTSSSSTTSSSTNTSSSGSSSSSSSKSALNIQRRSKSTSRSSSSSSSSSGSSSSSKSYSDSKSGKVAVVVRKPTPSKVHSATPRKTSKLQEIVRKMGNRPGSKVFKKNNKSGSSSASVHEKLIIKTAVVQLERDGYIDKLGKLYT